MKFVVNRDGHVPGYLQVALVEALEKSWAEGGLWLDMVEIYFFDPISQAAWATADARGRAECLLTSLQNCSTVVPEHVCVAVGLPLGSTFARLVRILKEGLRVGVSPSDCRYPY
jgi:hypothetical protein